MAVVVVGAMIAEGTRVRIRRGALPLDGALVGRTGTVVETSAYHAHRYGVVLDGAQEKLMLAPTELEVVESPPLVPPDREAAKGRRALP